ncbi:MAG: recA 1 [Pelosinus sp.]|nr:recA 1 [Pelosinus sp.]
MLGVNLFSLFTEHLFRDILIPNKRSARRGFIMASDKTKDFEKNREMDKSKALENAMRQIEKDFGAGAIMKLGEAAAKMHVEIIPTGSLPLDIALGVGGVPRGRVVEIFGPESSGKTTVALHIIAEAQKLDGIAAFIDAEHALDPSYAKKIGVDIDNLLISQPDNGEQALEIAEALVRSSAVDIIVIDSVAALVPKNEIDGDMGDSHVGLHARLMSQALRKLTGVISKSRTTVIFINQLREKVGVTWGNPETTTGGRALKFYASVRLDVRKKESLKQGNDVVGSRTKVKVVKNKIAPPFKQAEFDIMYGEGISRVGSLIDLGVELNVIDKSGSWLSYKENRLGQGRENVKTMLKENGDVANDIEKAIRDKIAGGVALPVVAFVDVDVDEEERYDLSEE